MKMNDFDPSNLHSISHNSSILDDFTTNDLNPPSNLDEKSLRLSLSDSYEEENKFIDNLMIKEINIKYIKKKNIFKIELIKKKRGRQLSKKKIKRIILLLILIMYFVKYKRTSSISLFL